MAWLSARAAVRGWTCSPPARRRLWAAPPTPWTAARLPPGRRSAGRARGVPYRTALAPQPPLAGLLPDGLVLGLGFGRRGFVLPRSRHLGLPAQLRLPCAARLPLSDEVGDQPANHVHEQQSQ